MLGCEVTPVVCVETSGMPPDGASPSSQPGEPVAALVLPKRIDGWSLTNLQGLRVFWARSGRRTYPPHADVAAKKNHNGKDHPVAIGCILIGNRESKNENPGLPLTDMFVPGSGAARPRQRACLSYSIEQASPVYPIDARIAARAECRQEARQPGRLCGSTRSVACIRIILAVVAIRPGNPS